MEGNIPYELIAKYLSNQCSEEEIQELNKWRTNSVQNEKVFVELRDEWLLLQNKLIQPVVMPDKEQVWNNIQNRIKAKTISYTRSYVFKVASLAASIALLIGFSLSMIFNHFDTNALASTFVAPKGQKSMLILADGSKVWLNSGSSLSVTNSFGAKDRIVRLEGEAFFDVKKNKRMKFIIKTGSVDVMVHGTAFNVKSYQTDTTVSVSLLRGSVEMFNATNNKSIAKLIPGDRVLVNKVDYNTKKESCDANLDAIWRLEKLKFEGATISEIAEKLSKWYGVEIVVNNDSKFQKYWFTVKNETLPEILNSMNGLHPIKYNIRGNVVEISSN